MWQAVLEVLTQEPPAPPWEAAARAIARQKGVRGVALLRAAPPEWECVAQEGADPPAMLAADALDHDAPVHDGAWSAAPLAGLGAALLVSPVMDTASLVELARTVTDCLKVADRQQRLEGEAQRLRKLLELVNQWRATNDLKGLLDQMASAACQLYQADRASIFLWDSPTRTLVGRPAIGIEGGELRIPDDAGVVGATLANGQAMRVSPGRDADAIDHSTDAKTGYVTRSLLAVPLVADGGRKLGVFELINKVGADAFTLEDERGLVDLAQYASAALSATQQYERLLDQHQRAVDQQAKGAQLIGQCPAMQALREAIDRVADTELSVLILGENGAGKEVVAQALHYGSRRRSAPFVAVNCAAIAETLLESELFGHERGAFTDAREARKGKFELAAGGTLLLDEIGDMSLGGQAKLLRVLEQKEVVRVGGSVVIETDVRVLAATNQDLAALVREKRFREDLYFRLNVATLETPPVRQRGADVVLLCEHFLEQFCRAAGRATPRFSAESKKRLIAHRWPGNVRELRNMMERLAYLSAGATITPADLSFTDSPGGKGEALLDLGLPLGEATDEFQRRYIQHAVTAAGGNVSEAAKALGVFRSNLYRKMKALDLRSDDA